MASGTISLGTSGQIEGRITWSSSSNGTSANSSQVTATIQVRRTNSYTTTGTWTGSLNIGGENQGFSVHSAVTNSWVTMKSFTITKAHNPDGTGTCYIQGGINGPSGTSQAGKNVNGAQTVTLDKIDRWATITSAPNFNDEENPKIEFYNPAGFTLQLKIEAGGNNSLIVRDNITSGSPYTFQLTNSERNALRALIPNSNTLSVRFTVGTYQNGTIQNWSYLDRTMTITNANPTFDVAYLDTNSTTTAITQNNQLLIQNNSTLQIKVTNASAKKSASLVRADTNINGMPFGGSFGHGGNGSNWVNMNVGALDLSQNLTINIVVTDSRDNTTTKQIELKMLQWSLPTALITMRRVSNFYSETNLKVDGTCSNLNNNNSLTIQYQYKKLSDTNYSALTTIQNNVETQFQADNRYEWNVRIILTDRLGSTTYNLILNKGIPIVFFDDYLSATGFNCFPKVNDSVFSSDLPIDDEILIGSQVIYDSYTMTSSGKNGVLGTYDYQLLEGIFDGIEIPSSYEKAYRITAQVSTANDNFASIFLNNIQSSTGRTWSGQSFRKTISTRVFKQSEIELENVINYSDSPHQGINLYCQNSANYNAYFYNITLQGYLVKIRNDRLSRLDAFVDKSTINGKTKAKQVSDAQFVIDHPDLDINDYTVSVGNPITIDNFNIISVAYFAQGNVEQLFDETYPNINANLSYKAIYVGEGKSTGILGRTCSPNQSTPKLDTPPMIRSDPSIASSICSIW